MPTLTLPQQTLSKLERRASAAGLTVTEFLDAIGAERVNTERAGDRHVPTPRDRRRTDFREWLAKLNEGREPVTWPVDCSRDAIYED